MTAEAIKARIIVDAIISDIKGRCGHGNSWEEIDDAFRDQIRDEWTTIVLRQSGFSG